MIKTEKNFEQSLFEFSRLERMEESAATNKTGLALASWIAKL